MSNSVSLKSLYVQDIAINSQHVPYIITKIVSCYLPFYLRSMMRLVSFVVIITIMFVTFFGLV